MVVIVDPVQSISEKDGLEDNQQRVPEAWNHGFPAGYFLIRSVATGRVLDVEGHNINDGAEVILYPSTETSLGEGKQTMFS